MIKKASLPKIAEVMRSQKKKRQPGRRKRRPWKKRQRMKITKRVQVELL
jgi:hypothetical protein